MPWMWLLRFVAGALSAASLAACATAVRDPVPSELTDQAVALDASVRQWGDEVPADIDAQLREKWAQRRAADRASPRGAPAEVSFLAISGGGSDGAFGAGLLAGWSAAGTRPEFDVVTGISTGALAAPFVFLGPEYDDALHHVYTSYATDDLITVQPLRGLLGGSAIASSGPLAEVIASYVDADFMAAIAREHARGRRLLIGTTNLDAQRPVIWDMGRIAASGHPDALRLFREVLLASAAIPGVLPPVHVEVTVDGVEHEEMHVDGGVATQVFLLPAEMMLPPDGAGRGGKVKRRLYVIRNGRLEPQFDAVPSRTKAIANRSISTLIKNQGIGDLVQLYAFANRNGIDYNLASIPGDVPDTSEEIFDTEYMAYLFDVGFELGRSGRQWQNTPPRIPEP